MLAPPTVRSKVESVVTILNHRFRIRFDSILQHIPVFVNDFFKILHNIFNKFFRLTVRSIYVILIEKTEFAYIYTGIIRG